MSRYIAASEYEKFVQFLYHAVRKADEEIVNLTTLRLEQRKLIRNRYGSLREFDVYWEYELDGIVRKTVIECKHYNSPIQIDKLDALVCKIRDIDEDLIAVVATKTGYQSGAKKAADYHGVELLVVREQKESDWKPEDGVAFARYITGEVRLLARPHIHSLHFVIDKVWIESNRPDIDTTSGSISLSNHESFVQDNQHLQSIEEFMNLLHPPYSEKYGRFQKEKKFKDAYLLHPTHGKLKMHSLEVDYSVGPPLTETINLDGTDALLGVIEYVQKGVKKLVFKNSDVGRIVTRRLG